MLVENSYFPVILGRCARVLSFGHPAKVTDESLAPPPHFAPPPPHNPVRPPTSHAALAQPPPRSSFMERRGVRTDPLDQTSVVFMDTNEVIPTDLVVVKDRNGVVVPIS